MNLKQAITVLDSTIPPSNNAKEWDARRRTANS